jgi:biotin operon repressor
MEKQFYTRITEKLRKNKDLTPLHKLLIGFLNTYQSNPDGTPTNKFYYDTQVNLAEELGVSLKSINNAIDFLEEKGIIFKKKKSDVDKKPQFKNRKAIILVDKYNPLPKTENKAPESIILPQPIPEVQVEEKVSEIENKVSQIESNETIEKPQDSTYDKYREKWINKRHFFDHSDLCNFNQKYTEENSGIKKYVFRLFVKEQKNNPNLSFEEFLTECDNLINNK